MTEVRRAKRLVKAASLNTSFRGEVSVSSLPNGGIRCDGRPTVRVEQITSANSTVLYFTPEEAVELARIILHGVIEARGGGDE